MPFEPIKTNKTVLYASFDDKQQPLVNKELNQPSKLPPGYVPKVINPVRADQKMQQPKMEPEDREDMYSYIVLGIMFLIGISW